MTVSRYEYQELAEQLARAPTELRLVLTEFEAWCALQNFPAPVVTCVHRTPEQNKAAGGVPNSLHLDSRAMDLRNRHYTPEQRMECEQWLRARCPRWAFEMVLKPHGTGPHWHIGVHREDVHREES